MMLFTGTLFKEDGTEEKVSNKHLIFEEYQPQELDAGIRGECVIVCDAAGDETYTVDPDEWYSNECVELRGGHNWVKQQWPGEDETICAHCGIEKPE